MPESLARPDAAHAERAVLNAFTVDVEDYYHVASFEGQVTRAEWGRWDSRVTASTHLLLDMLADAGVRGTFFVLGWVAERHPELVRRIASRGHEIASHGYAHRLVYDLCSEVERLTQVLEENKTLGHSLGAIGTKSMQQAGEIKQLQKENEALRAELAELRAKVHPNVPR